MTARRVLWRTLRYYWSTGVCAALGLAVAAGVITGSLVIGDSVRGSIRDTALARLGDIGLALQAPRFVRLGLADDLRRQPGVAQAVSSLVPLVIARGSVLRQEDQQVIPNVTVIGAPPEFWALYGPAARPAISGQTVAVNAALAGDLDLTAGASLLVNVQKSNAVAGDTLFAGRKHNDAVSGLMVDVGALLPDGGVGDFRSDAQTAVPRNLFVDRDWLAEQLGQSGKANGMVAEAKPGQAPAALDALTKATEAAAMLEDRGLAVRADAAAGVVRLTSSSMVLTAPQVTGAEAAAKSVGAATAPNSVYLCTRLKVAGSPPGQRELSYAIAASPSQPGGFLSADGARLPPGGAGRGGIWLNEWAATDLRARVGDKLQVSFFVPTDDGTYPEQTLTVSLTRVVKIAGPAADRDLLPELPGITDAATIDSWKAPFPVDVRRITPRDEQYWKLYRATPKAFLSLETLQAMWQAGPGHADADWVTSVTVTPRPGQTLGQLQKAFGQALAARLPAGDSGLAFVPVRELALKAAQGTSDFGQLFLGLSFFIVAAGLALSGMLLRLSLERRAGQVGLLLACGWSERRVGRLLVAEGMLLSVAGTLVGVPAGVGYARLLIAALTSHWSGALGMTSRLWLHVTPTSLVSGALSGLALGLLMALWSARRLSRAPVLELLSGWQAMGVATPSRGRVTLTRVTAFASLALAALAVVAGTRGVSPVPAFFAAGFLLLIGGLAATRLALAWMLQARGATRSLGRLAVRNAAAQVGRSLLVVGLLASATFVLVAVATNARDLSRLDPSRKDSGTGGFTLRAVASVPLPADPATAKGRANLGFDPADEARLEGVEILSLLASPGEDISCLNLARSTQPRLLGVSGQMVARGGFAVYTGAEGKRDPWEALTDTGEMGPIHAFGDASSVEWSLHSGLGKQYTIQVPGRGSVPLEFQGLVQSSIFQGELLVSAANFRRLYPSITRPSYFLIATPPGREAEVAAALRRNLGDYGVEVRSTQEILQGFLGVQNAYLAMFLALGGVGLMLGTVGLAVLILRTALERRGQFALLMSAGLSPGALARLLLLEHSGLLLAGLVLGTVAALVAVAPQLASATAAVNWSALLAVLLGTLAIGLGTCVAAAWTVVRGPLVEGLRAE